MQLLSVNVAKPRLRRFKLKLYTTAFQKHPTQGKTMVDRHNLIGDKQADLLNHGGLDKAVYGFSSNHFTHWQQHLSIPNIPYGKFGENLTISDLDEKQLAIGDRVQINDCVLEVSQPRIPCYKISFEFSQIPMLNDFIDYGHTGVYFRVIEPGIIESGSEVELIYKHPENVTIYNLFKVHFDSKFPNQERIMRQAVDIPQLAENWRIKVKERLHLIDLYHQRKQGKK